MITWNRSLIAVLLASASCAQAHAEGSPLGTWSVEGRAGATRYRGVVVVKSVHKKLVLSRAIDGKPVGRLAEAPQLPDPNGRWRFVFEGSAANGLPGLSGKLTGGQAEAPAKAIKTVLEVARRSAGGFKARLWRGDRVAAKERWSAPRNELVFVGMGVGGHHEVVDLRSRNRVRILEISNSRDGQDRLRHDGKLYDLRGLKGIQDYLDAIGAGSKAAALAPILRDDSAAKARDEVALLIKAFLEAERGERVVERLVFSGHSLGSGVWGDDNGTFRTLTLKKIAQVLPLAASQVEDLMIAGCYSLTAHILRGYQGMFPNLKTVWAYNSSAPGTWAGAMIHNRIWEQATRGHDPSKVQRDLAKGTRKGENVLTWNAAASFSGATRSLRQIEYELSARRAQYQAFLQGSLRVKSTQSGPLREYYALIQEKLGNPHLRHRERGKLETLRNQTIRLIFYDAMVKAKFMEAHGAAVRAGFEALGLEAPDFAKLSRKAALTRIAQFLRACGANAPSAAKTLLPLLRDGLRDLRASQIPNTWI